MGFRAIVVAVAVFVIFAVGAFAAFQVAATGQNAAADTPRNVTNESVVVEYDTFQQVDRVGDEFTTGFGNTTTVYNSTGAELTRGEDYRWNQTDGTIRFLNTSDTTEGNSANISYVYFENTDAVKNLSGPLTAIAQALGRFGLLAGGFALVVLVIAFGGFVATRLGGSDYGGR